MTEPNLKQSRDSSAGALLAASAFVIWGISPIFWNQLQAVPAMEIVTHRVVWSPLFLLPVMLRQQRWGEVASAFSDPKTILTLLLTTILISANWLTFIWAINNDQVLQTSIGYYITPLINVLLGMVFLGERLRPLQGVALALAAGGVTYLALDYGRIPWIALALGFTFGFYSLVHKVIAVSSIAGLMLEMLLLSVPAVAYLVYLDRIGTGAFLHSGAWTDLLLAGTSLFTAFPLLLFTSGAKRLHLSTLGFLQYIAPSGYFLLAVLYFHEPVSRAQVLTFVLIWLALCCYSTDSVLYYRLQVKKWKKTTKRDG
ncbi:MAG: EamA family transporter RarD [Desulfobacteraceae bacterium]|nr:EamA family transporter RarD [Desulfobacteraceae bacterium]